MKKISKKNIVLSILTVFAIIVAIYSVGNTILMPFPTSIEFNNKYSGFFSNVIGRSVQIDDDTVVFDKEGTRVSTLNSKGQLTYVNDSNIFAADTRFYDFVVKNGEDYYMQAHTNYQNSDNIKTEMLLKYDAIFQRLNIVYELNYSQDQNIIFPNVLDLMSYNNDLYYLCKSKDSSLISVKKICNFDHLEDYAVFDMGCIGNDVMSASYNFENNICAVITNTMYVITNNNNSIVKTPPPSNLDSPFSNCIINQDGSIKTITFDEQNNSIPKSADFSPMLIFTTWITWLSIAYLIFIIIYLLIKILRPKNKTTNTKNILLGIAAVLLIVFISCYYTANMYQTQINNNANIVSATVDNFANTLSAYASDPISKSEKMSDLENDDINKLKSYMDNLDIQYRDQNINLDFQVFALSESEPNNIYIYDSGQKFMPYVYYFNKNNQEIQDLINELSNHRIIKMNSDVGGSETISSFKGIFKDNDNLIGAACCEVNFTTLIDYMSNNAVNLFLVLLVILISVALFILEINQAFISVKDYKKSLSAKHKNNELNLYRPIRFLVNFLIVFNSVLLVLITKDILEKSGMDSGGILLSIPPFLASAGLLGGQAVYDIFSKRIKIKQFMFIMCILQIATFVLCYIAIKNSDYILFCVGTGFASICTGTIAGLTMFMPIVTDNEKKRFDMYNHKALASIAASAISVAISGSVADLFGNEYVYIMVIVPTAILGLILMFSLPKNTIYSKIIEKSKKRVNVKEILKVLLHPAFISLVVFIILPKAVAGGYKSFLFPLFSDSSGYSKTVISNFVVIANFIAYLMNRPLSNISNKYDYWKATCLCMFAFAIVYLTFSLNSTILWSFLVIAFVAIISKFLHPNSSLLWPRLCKEKGVPQSPVNSFLIYFDNFSNSICPVILSLFIVLGPVMACVSLGIWFLASAVLFAITTYKSPLNKKDN